MQDEHFIRQWNEGHTRFSADLASVVNAAGGGLHLRRNRTRSIQQTCERAGPDTLLALCRGRLATLFGWAIPGGFLLGTVVAALALATAPPAPRLAVQHHTTVASYTLPYLA